MLPFRIKFHMCINDIDISSVLGKYSWTFYS